MTSRIAFGACGAVLALCANFAGATAAVANGDGGAAASDAFTISEDVIAEGKALYLKNCKLCHGTKGTSGKRLSQNKKVADAEYVARTIITGPGYMTEFGPHLSDEEIALIVTYVRNEMGNSYGPMNATEVKQLR